MNEVPPFFVAFLWIFFGSEQVAVLRSPALETTGDLGRTARDYYAPRETTGEDNGPSDLFWTLHGPIPLGRPRETTKTKYIRIKEKMKNN